MLDKHHKIFNNLLTEKIYKFIILINNLIILFFVLIRRVGYVKKRRIEKRN